MLFLLIFWAELPYLEKMLMKTFKSEQSRSGYIWKQELQGACDATIWGVYMVLCIHFVLLVQNICIAKGETVIFKKN